MPWPDGVLHRRARSDPGLVDGSRFEPGSGRRRYKAPASRGLAYAPSLTLGFRVA